VEALLQNTVLLLAIQCIAIASVLCIGCSSWSVASAPDTSITPLWPEGLPMLQNPQRHLPALLLMLP